LTQEELLENIISSATDLIGDREYAEAEDILLSALNKNKLHKVKIYDLLVKLYIKMDHLEKAHRIVEAGLSEYPNNPWLFRSLIQIQLEEKNFSAAMETVNKIPADQQITYDKTLLNKIKLLVEANKPKVSMTQEELEEAVSKSTSLLEENKYSEAETILQNLIVEKSLFRVQVYIALIKLYIQTENIAKARKTAINAIKDYQNNQWTSRSLMNVYMLTKEYKEILTLFSSLSEEEKTVEDIEMHTKALIGLNELDQEETVDASTKISILLNEHKIKDAIKIINQIEQPWSKATSQSAIDIVLSALQINLEYTYSLLIIFVDKIQNKKFFFKALLHKFLRTSAWTDDWGQNEKSSGYRFLTFLSYMFREKLDVNIRMHLAAKHLNYKKYTEVIDLLEEKSFDPIQQINRDWLLVLAKSNLNLKLDDIQDVLIPDNIELNNTLYHYKYSSSKCLFLFTTSNQNNMGVFIGKVSEILKKLKISLIVVVDKRNKMCLTGLDEYNIEDTINQLENTSRKFNYKNIAFFGGSAPGLSTMIYGLPMNISGILGINSLTYIPKVNIDNSSTKSIKQKEVHEFFNSEESVAETLSLVLGSTQIPYYDAVEYLENNKSTLIMLLYSKDFEFDMQSATRLKPFSNVILKPMECDNHFLLNLLIENNLLEQNIEDFFKSLKWI